MVVIVMNVIFLSVSQALYETSNKDVHPSVIILYEGDMRTCLWSEAAE